MDDSAVVAPPHIGKPFRLHPFRGLTLAPQQIGDPRAARLLARPYRGVPARMALWERSGRLLRDAEPAIHVHEYTVAGLTIRGLVGALELSHRAAGLSDRSVLPHEGVHPKRVNDLAHRLLELSLNPAPILLVHRGPVAIRDLVQGVLDSPASRSFVDHQGNQHRLWALADAEVAKQIEAGLATATPVIADGHHRYAAYLRLQAENPGTAWDRGLAMLVDQDDTPLFLGAIHRVLAGTTFSALRALAARTDLVLTPCTAQVAVDTLGPTTVVLTDGTEWATLDLPVRTGDAAVNVLHATVIPQLRPSATPIAYHHSVEEALTHLRKAQGVAVLLPSPGYDLVHDLVAQDRLLPEKATSFQPKPPYGVLMRSLLDE